MGIRLLTAAALPLIVLALSGCAPTALTTSESATPAPSQAPTPGPTQPALPQSSFSVGCEEILPLEELRALVATDLAPVDAKTGWPFLEDSSILQASGLVCEWHSASTEAVVRAVALPDATAGFEQSRVAHESREPRPYLTALPLLDGALGHCLDYYVRELACSWTVLAGSVWLSATIELLAADQASYPDPRINPDTSSNPLWPNVDGSATALVVSAATLLRDSQRPSVPPTTVTAPCEQFLEVSSLASELRADSVKVTDYRATRDVTFESAPDRAMYQFAFERLGYRKCNVEIHINGGPRWVDFVVAPGASWIVDHRAASAGSSLELGIESSGCADLTGNDVSSPYCRADLATEDGVITASQNDTTDPLLVTAVFDSVRKSLDW